MAAREFDEYTLRWCARKARELARRGRTHPYLNMDRAFTDGCNSVADAVLEKAREVAAKRERGE